MSNTPLVITILPGVADSDWDSVAEAFALTEGSYVLTREEAETIGKILRDGTLPQVAAFLAEAE